MARDSSGPKNEPQYSGSGAPADAADLTEVAAYAARQGNRRSDVDTVRTGLVGNDLFEGLEFYATDTDADWIYENAAWTRLDGRGAVMQLFTAGTTDQTSASFATAFAFGSNVTVPNWATSARFTVMISQWQSVTSTGNNFQARVNIGSSNSTAVRMADPAANGTRTDTMWGDKVTGLTPGASVALNFQVQRVSGTGALRIDTVSIASISLDFLP